MRVQDIAGAGADRKVSSQANYAWRVFATGLSFFTFGVGGIVLSSTFIPLLYLFVWSVEKRNSVAREIVRFSFRGFIWWMSFLRVIDYDFNVGPLKSARGKIIIANHPTLIDVVAIISMTPRADCVVKAELFRNPFIRAIIRSTGYISNSDPELLVKDCDESLSRGNNLIIFPEGTRTKPNKPECFQRGPANIALRTNKPFLAFKITCEPSTLKKGSPWYRSPKEKPKLKIRYLKEIEVTEYLNESSVSNAARKLTRDLEAYYREVK